MFKNFNKLITGLICIAAVVHGADTFIIGQSKSTPNDSWTDNKTRIQGYDQGQVDTKYSRYGELLRAQYSGTVFFYTKKVGKRWFFIDPEGYLFIKKGLTSAKITNGEPYESAFKKKFTSSKDLGEQDHYHVSGILI